MTERFFATLTYVQTRFAWVLSGAFLLIGALCWPLVDQLELDTAWTALLPTDKPSVRDAERIGKRIGGLSTLIPVLQSRDVEAMKRFAKDLVPRLAKLTDEGVDNVEWNIAAYDDFVVKHKYLYTKLEDLNEIHDVLQERLDYERLKHNPLYIDLDDEGDKAEEPEAIIERIESKARAMQEKRKRFPGGFYIHPDNDLLAIFLRTNISGGDIDGVKRLKAAIEREIQALNPSRYAPDLIIEYAGDLPRTVEEHAAIKQELLIAVALASAMILAVVLIFFRRFRALPLLGLTVAIPSIATFAMTELVIGKLNSSTAFLGSIIIGNGINPSIIWLARYFEERRAGKSVYDATYDTHISSWKAIMAAALAGTFAYTALMITEFRGFRDFGIISALGMFSCWLGTVFILPTFNAVYESIRPFPAKKNVTSSELNLYGLAFRHLVFRAPGVTVTIAGLLVVGGLVATGIAIAKDPIEYNFRKLSSQRETASHTADLMRKISEIVGQAGSGNGIAMWVPNLDEVLHIKRELEQNRDQHGAAYGAIRGIDNLLPKDQAQKIDLLRDIRRQLLEIRPFATPEQQARIDTNLPPEHIALVRAEELPIEAVRLFTERNGVRGRILIIEQQLKRSTWDGRYLVAWAHDLRKVHLKDGTSPPLAGRAPIFADIIEAIWVDGPKTIAASFSFTVFLIFLAFRHRRERWLTLAALLVGVTWMAGVMTVLRIKLNFLNFVAFPITFGIGVDYGVNVMRRYVSERENGLSDLDAIRTAVEQSGGAVTLCSMTTVLGYMSLFTSANQALTSFAAAMTISEIACLLAAVLALPAWLVWRAQRKTTVAWRF